MMTKLAPLIGRVWLQGQNPPPCTCINLSVFDLIWHPFISSIGSEASSIVHTCEGKKKKIWLLCWRTTWHLFDLHWILVCFYLFDQALVCFWRLRFFMVCLLSLIKILLFFGVVDQELTCSQLLCFDDPLTSCLRPKFSPSMHTLTWINIEYFSLIWLVWLGIYWGQKIGILFRIFWCMFWWIELSLSRKEKFVGCSPCGFFPWSLT